MKSGLAARITFALLCSIPVGLAAQGTNAIPAAATATTAQSTPAGPVRQPEWPRFDPNVSDSTDNLATLKRANAIPVTTIIIGLLVIILLILVL